MDQLARWQPGSQDEAPRHLDERFVRREKEWERPEEIYQRFRFEGSAAEYFKIWIVNILLSIVTLGVYSAWAKVRRKRYYYGNTYLLDSPFEYHADPVKILKGRILVAAVLVAVLGAFILTLNFQPLYILALTALFVIALPWLVVRARTFTARNSSYRNIRFNFGQNYWGATKAFIWPVVLMFAATVAVSFLGGMLFGPFALLGPIAGFILYSYWAFARNRFVVNESMYGKTRFSFHGDIYHYYGIFFRAGLWAFLLGVVLAAVYQLIALGSDIPMQGGQVAEVSPLTGLLLQVPSLIVALFIAVYIRTSILNEVLDNTSIGKHKLFSLLVVPQMFWIYLTNIIAIILSVGLLTPWAGIRLARYKLENIGVEIGGDMNQFVADVQAEVPAAAEEVAEFFDIDIGI